MGVILMEMVTFQQLLSFIDPHSRVKSKAIFNSREMLRSGASLGSAGSRECPRPGPPSCSNPLYYRLSVTYLNSDPMLRLHPYFPKISKQNNHISSSSKLTHNKFSRKGKSGTLFYGTPQFA